MIVVMPYQTKEFLSKILPRTGVYVLAEFRNGLKNAPLHHFYSTVEELTLGASKYDATGVNVFHACATYLTDANRKQVNAGWMRSIWLDIDCMKANDAKSYATRKEALAATLGMCEKLGLPAPMIVKSGMGLHVYWVLDADITKDEWTPIVGAFSNALNSVGFKHDPSRTKDASSVLRPVGTHWRKGGVKPVELIHNAPEYPVEIFNAIIGQYGGDYAQKSNVVSLFNVSNDLGAGIEYPPSSAYEIVKHCPALSEVAQKRGAVSEPLWRAMIGVTKHTVEGDELVHEWSKGDSRYSKTETQRKIDGWVNGPSTCSHISDHSDKCKSCKHFGKIVSPIQLGIAPEEAVTNDNEPTRFPMSEGLIAFSDSPPPPREYLLYEIICAQKVAVLAGLGGVAKTMWLMMCATSVALGTPFMNKATKQGAVLLILGEEDHEEISRRFNTIAKYLNLNASQKKLITQRVRAFPMSGLDTRLTQKVSGTLYSTNLTSDLIKLTKQLEAEAGLPVTLIGLDHAGLIHGGEFNAREDVVQTMREVSAIAQQTKSAVLVLAHSPKASVGKEKTDSTDVAGSTAWVDLARAVYVLRAMTEEEAKQLGLSKEIAKNYTSFNVVKNNYGPSNQQIWLNKITVPFYSSIVLEHVDLQAPPPTVKLTNGLEARLLEMITEYPGRFTKTNLRENYSGKDSRLKASKANVTIALDDMLLEGKLSQRPPSEEERKKYGLKSQVAEVLEVMK